MSARIFCLALALLLARAAFPAASTDVPLDHPVYRFLATLNAPAILDGFDYSVKPYSEAQVVRLLKYELDGNPSANRKVIQQYLAEFDAAVQAGHNLPTFRFPGKRDTLQFYPVADAGLTYQDSNYSPLGYHTWGFDSLSGTKEIHTLVNLGGVMRGEISGLALYFKGSIGTEYSTEKTWIKSMDPRHGAFYTTILVDPDSAGHLIGYDRFTAYAKLSLPYFDLKAGRDRIAYGFSEGDGLLLSGRADPFFNVQLSRNFGRLSYHFIVGKLLADTYDQKRYLYAKRLQYQPLSWLSLGFSDEAVSINRDLEPVYFLPMVPYYFSEHYLGDPDNRLMAFDARVALRGRASLYGELLLDDIRDMLGLFHPDDISNKFGLLAGLNVSSPWPRVASGARIEFIQIEPWVYTTSAKDNRGTYNYPVHFGSVLGSPLGPNARALEISLSGPFYEKLRTSLSLCQIWKGRTSGSFEYDLNPVDTLTGERLYDNKKDRFSLWGRNRTVLSLEAEIQPWRWNRYGLTLGWIHERALEPGDYFQASGNAFFNF